MHPAIAWAAATVGTLAWILLGALFDRYAPRSRYSGMGVLLVLYYGVAPAVSLLFAFVHQLLRGRRLAPGLVAVTAGAVPVVLLAVTVVSGEQRLADARRDEARARAARERIEAEVEAMDLPELLRVAEEATPRGDRAGSVAFARLRRESADCSLEPARATDAMRALASTRAIAIPSLANAAKDACPALRAPLREALVAGLSARPNAAGDATMIAELVRADPSMLGEVHARVAFSGDAAYGALMELVSFRTTDGYTRARRLLELGLEPSRGESEAPLSESFREHFLEKNEAWPEGASAEELALHRALVERERR